MKKYFGAALVGLLGIFALPNAVDAKTITVGDQGDYTSLKEAVTAAESGDIISLTKDVTINSKEEIVEITGKEITIDGGEGVTITGYRDDTPKEEIGGNHSLITASVGAKIHLKNVTLIDSQKYGVQAYDGGYVSLDNVTINNCRFGAVLINAGTIEVINVKLGSNGETENNGIEVSKSIKLEGSANQPQLIMNGTIASDKKENVIRFASDENDATTEFIIENKENSTDKILANGNTVVITDSNNDVKFTSNEATATVDGDKYVDDSKPTEPTEPTDKPTEEAGNEVKNPQTFDGITIIFALLGLSLVATGICFRKLYVNANRI